MTWLSSTTRTAETFVPLALDLSLPCGISGKATMSQCWILRRLGERDMACGVAGLSVELNTKPKSLTAAGLTRSVGQSEVFAHQLRGQSANRGKRFTDGDRDLHIMAFRRAEVWFGIAGQRPRQVDFVDYGFVPERW